jgi:hypothetical protein
VDQPPSSLRPGQQKGSPASYRCHQQPARIYFPHTHREPLGWTSRRHQAPDRPQSRVERGRWRRGWHHGRELDDSSSLHPHIHFVQNLPAFWISATRVLLFSPLYTTRQDCNWILHHYMAARESLASLVRFSYFVCTIPARNDFPQARILDIPLPDGFLSH